jgi:poly(3-hydroxybutyrate) depolymerase
MFKIGLIVPLLCALCLVAEAQAPKEFRDQFPPSTDAKLVTIKYLNSMDGSPNEALLEVPAPTGHPYPLIVTPNAANWTQEMNQSLWSGVASKFGVMILYPRHKGPVNPNVTLGSPKQIANLESAITEVEKEFSIDKTRVYAAGLSQGAIETLLVVGADSGRFAGAMAINPIPDFLAFYQDLTSFLAHPPDGTQDPLVKLRLGQWPPLVKLLEFDTGGTPDTKRAAYYSRSSVIYAQQLARTPLIIYWASDDELIPNGADHQGGMLADLIRSFHPENFHEVKHTGGHGYPFYQYDLTNLSVKIFPRDIFLDSVKQMLEFRGASGR